MGKSIQKAKQLLIGTDPQQTFDSVIKTRQSQTQAFCCESGQQKVLLLSDLASLSQKIGQEDSIVIVIENIDLNWITELSKTFSLDNSFFREHALNPEDLPPWKAIFGDGKSVTKQKRPIQRIERAAQSSHQPGSLMMLTSWHVDGVFSWEFSETSQENPTPPRMEDPNFFKRHLVYDLNYGWQANTRISHCQVNKNTYMFLVDASMRTVSSSLSPLDRRDTLHLPVSHSRGGLLIPPLSGLPKYSMFECLSQFFTHAWHLDVIMHSILAPETILYLLVASTWSYNLKEITQDTKHIAFNDLRRPRIHINDRLLDQRQKIIRLREEVLTTRKWIPAQVQDELQGVRNTIEEKKYVGFPHIILDEVLTGSETTERFLMDTFQLLISSISVLDSETSIRQNYSAQKLTQLAFIFVPLNLVTSIFGMNLSEINGSFIPAWVCILVLVIILTCTVGIFAAYNQWEKHLKGRKL